MLVPTTTLRSVASDALSSHNHQPHISHPAAAHYFEESIDISSYTPNHNPMNNPHANNTLNLIVGAEAKANHSNEDSGDPLASAASSAMYERNDCRTNTTVTDVNEVSMKIDFSDIFRDSAYTHDSTTWTQCFCNQFYAFWELVSCKELDVKWYKRLLVCVLIMNLGNFLVEIGGLINEIHENGSHDIVFEVLYSFGISIVLVNCLLIIKLIFRPTTRSALLSSVLILVLLTLDTVQIATYRNPQEIRDAITISICALFLFFQMSSAVLLYRYWEYAMFHFDDHANLRELFLENSGEYSSSNTKHYDDLTEVTKHAEKGIESSVSHSRLTLQQEEDMERNSVTITTNGASTANNASVQIHRPSQPSQGQSFSSNVRSSFTFGSPAGVLGSTTPNASPAQNRTPRSNKQTPRTNRTRHASMLSNRNVSLHNSLLQQQQQAGSGNSTSNVPLAHFLSPDNDRKYTTTQRKSVAVASSSTLNQTHLAESSSSILPAADFVADQSLPPRIQPPATIASNSNISANPPTQITSSAGVGLLSRSSSNNSSSQHNIHSIQPLTSSQIV